MDVKDAFSILKPICDGLMVRPTMESLDTYIFHVKDLSNQAAQDLQQYLLFPLITHLNSPETKKNSVILEKMVDAMRLVLDKVKVHNYEMCMKAELGMLQLVFDPMKPGMIADISEELKLCIMRSLTVLMLNLQPNLREFLLKTQVPLLGKAVYVSVHIAKLEKLRPLRLAAINCVTAHTATHKDLTNNFHVTSPTLEKYVVDMLSKVLPGVLGALQDVATSSDNPGHVLIVTAIDAMHRILCLAMNNKFMKLTDFTAEDFAKLIKEKENKEVSSKAPADPKSYRVRSPPWFTIAGEKLLLVTQSLVSLRTHEHFRVRKELALYCARLLFECNVAMQSSIPIVLDVLISLTEDEYPEVSEYCSNAINTYLAHASEDNKAKTLDVLCENFFATLTSFPRIMNNIDSARKLSALTVVHGYIRVLNAGNDGRRLSLALSDTARATAVCTALTHAAAMQPGLTVLTQHALRDIKSKPPTNSPWCSLRHLDSEACVARLTDICVLLGAAPCADLLLDSLLDMFVRARDPHAVYIMNWMCTAPNSSEKLIRRILSTYIEEHVWYLPLEVCSVEPPLSDGDTMDVSVYNPRSWHKDTVPDLYEGAVETRYTDISYSAPRLRPPPRHNTCATLAEAQRNMLLSCLLTEGLGAMATRLRDNYQPYLLKTLCLVLERVGSKYEMLHLAGLKAIHAISAACGHSAVPELIRCNADYFTNQVTVRLKKAWNCQSALQILSVVMEYSDSNILNYLYGIVQDVLVQSCDKHYEKDLYAYLQVFLTFLECIRKWYMIPQRWPNMSQENPYIDILQDTKEYIESREEVERLLNDNEFEKETGKSVEEMYREDVKRKEENELDYDDTVTEEKPPPPQYVTVTVTILKRCLNYVVSSQRDTCILSLQVLNTGLPILRGYDNELLPLVHLTWAPLVNKFEDEPIVVRRAFDLLVTLAELSKDFIRSRAVTEVLPHVYKFLQQYSRQSYLKDVGSCYRSSAAYSVQLAALRALARLAAALRLAAAALEDAMACVDAYLSNKQPRPLQLSAVEFFRQILDYDYGAAWYHLRTLCNNDQELHPPASLPIQLDTIVGTPYLHPENEYENNVKEIFTEVVS